MDSAFFSALVSLAANPWQPMGLRGTPRLWLLPLHRGPWLVSHDGVTVVLGAAELWIPSDTAIFWAPVTIVHYIDAHGYRPPDAFVDAVRACPPMRSMAYLRALRAHGMNRETDLRRRRRSRQIRCTDSCACDGPHAPQAVEARLCPHASTIRAEKQT
ncbi:MAG: hypothetical protein H6723_15845 [Sandaracinus sp.]|nr:hypothetical protein [Sandaracinus sp.]